jgi:hypothetical protein
MQKSPEHVTVSNHYGVGSDLYGNNRASICYVREINYCQVALGQFSSEYFGFPSQFSLHQLLHIH